MAFLSNSKRWTLADENAARGQAGLPAMSWSEFASIARKLGSKNGEYLEYYQFPGGKVGPISFNLPDGSVVKKASMPSITKVGGVSTMMPKINIAVPESAYQRLPESPGFEMPPVTYNFQWGFPATQQAGSGLPENFWGDLDKYMSGKLSGLSTNQEAPKVRTQGEYAEFGMPSSSTGVSMGVDSAAPGYMGREDQVKKFLYGSAY